MRIKFSVKRLIACIQVVAVLFAYSTVSDLSSAYVSAAEPQPVSKVSTPAEVLSDRALVAIDASGSDTTVTDVDGKEYNSGVYMSWRAFEEDPDDVTFTVYRNGSVIASDIAVTNLLDEGGTSGDTYTVSGSSDADLGISTVATKVWNEQYLEVSLCVPASQTMPNGSVTYYHANDMSVGDLNGDGDYELIVKWYPSNAQDNSNAGYTGTTIIDAYDIHMSTGAAELMWRIDLGVNIRSGAHYTQFQVWDFNGDGVADIAMKTADGSTTYVSRDGTDRTLVETGHVGAVSASALPTNRISASYDYRNDSGYILSGDEYFTIFDGLAGEIIDTAAYLPARGAVGNWGDEYGNRVDRFLSAVAYLDGQNPYAIFARGYYTRTALTAYYLKDTNGDGIGDKIDIYWTFDTDTYDFTGSGATKSTATGQGNHNLSVNDVNGDGKDEIIYGALVMNHDGTIRYTTTLGHGDAQHISDWVPWNDGLEVLSVHETKTAKYGVEMHDASTGEILMGYYTGTDTGRGVAADIDPTAPGAEFWASSGPSGTGGGGWDSTDAGVFSTASSLQNLVRLSNSSPVANFSIFWDGDLLSEILDHTFDSGRYLPTGITVAKWNYEKKSSEYLFNTKKAFSSNGTKGNPGLAADILGDWREEIIVRTTNGSSKQSRDNVIRIYTTSYMTDYVVPTLMQNRAYRIGIAWQNVAYNQPANLDYLLSKGVIAPQLMLNAKSYNEVKIDFTEASDGVYGYDVEGYEIYRSANGGAYKRIDTANGDAAYQEGGVLYQFDIGTKNGTAPGFTNITTTPYTAVLGYGFTSSAAITGGSIGVSIPADDGSGLYTALSDMAYATGELTYAADVEPGVYKVDVYSSSGASNTTYNPNKIYINGVDLGTSVNQSAAISPDEALKTLTVTISAGEQIVVSAKNEGSRAFINAIVITKMVVSESSGSPAVFAFTNGIATFVDNTVEPKTTYSYRIASTVNGRTGYLSKSLTTTTGFKITEIPKFVLDDLAQYTPIPNGGTVVDFLPAFVTVLNEAGEESEAEVFGWNPGALDITALGEYTVTADIVGYDEPAEYTVSVVERQPVTYKDVILRSIMNTEIHLPDAVTVTFTNTITENMEVLWNTAGLHADTPGLYEITGKLVDYPNFEVKMSVNVVTDYITGIVTDKIYMEAVIGSSPEDVNLPQTVKVSNYIAADSDAAVKWDLSSWDTSKEAVKEIKGTVEGYDGSISLQMYVDYATYQKFDFGISTGKVENGWMGITVNAKGGTKTNDELGLAYTAEKGYGFLNLAGSDKAMEGRTEEYTLNGILPYNVYTDFALISGQDFAIDVPNGRYVVEGVITSGADVNTSTFSIEGGQEVFTLSNGSGGNYGINQAVVNVTDGQLNVVITGTNNRVGALIVRQVSVLDESPIINYDKSIIVEAINGSDISAIVLPSTITVYFENGSSAKANVLWNLEEAGVLTGVEGDYTITGVLTDYEHYEVTMIVRVSAERITAITTGDIYIEAALGSALDTSLFPSAVAVKYSGGNTGTASVTWDFDAWDTSAVSTVAIKGTVEGYDGHITTYVYADYAAVYKFDFGISSGLVADGWTGVTVNAKGGTKTYEQLGISYDAEKGYGFCAPDGSALSGKAAMEGRTEGYTMNGILPYNVYTDFAMPSNSTDLAADVPNGKYIVSVVVTSTSSPNEVNYSIEGISQTKLKNPQNNYIIGRAEVEVTDGQINIAFSAGTNRIGAIIIRAVEEIVAPPQPSADKNELITLYEANTGKYEEQYTLTSWLAFNAALEGAADTIADDTATQNDVNNALQLLSSAIIGLTVRADMSALNELIASAQAIDTSGYTGRSVLKLVSALGAAQSLAENLNAAQADANAAYKALAAAIDALEIAIVNPESDKTALQTITGMIAGLGISGGQYTEASYEAYAEALLNALDVLDYENAGQNDIDLAIYMLLNTAAQLENLLEREVNAEEIVYLINAANGLMSRQNSYTADSWAAFMAAYASALNTCLTSDNQEDIDTARGELQNAVNSLVLKPSIEAITVTGGIYAAQNNTTVYTATADENVKVNYTFAARDLEHVGTMEVVVYYDNTVMTIDEITAATGISVFTSQTSNGDITALKVAILSAQGLSISNTDLTELFTISFALNDDGIAFGDTLTAAIAVDGFKVVYYPDGNIQPENMTLAETILEPGNATTNVLYLYSRYDSSQNGVIDIFDVEYVRIYLGASEGDGKWDKAARCDFNNDGIIDITDLTMMLAVYFAQS